MLPDVGSFSRVIQRIRVDFPEPRKPHDDQDLGPVDIEGNIAHRADIAPFVQRFVRRMAIVAP